MFPKQTPKAKPFDRQEESGGEQSLTEALTQLEEAAGKLEDVMHAKFDGGGFNPDIDEDYISKMSQKTDESSEELIRYIQDMIGMMSTEDEDIN